MHPLLAKRIEIPFKHQVLSFIANDGQIWLAAWLFPIKCYVVLAAMVVIGIHFLSTGWIQEAGDFQMITAFVAAGYFLSSTLLVLGGLLQKALYSHPAALRTLFFGVAALIIGICLKIFASHLLGLEKANLFVGDLITI